MEGTDGGVGFTSFQAGEISPIHVRNEGKMVLGNVKAFSYRGYSCTDF